MFCTHKMFLLVLYILLVKWEKTMKIWIVCLSTPYSFTYNELFYNIHYYKINSRIPYDSVGVSQAEDAIGFIDPTPRKVTNT